jgi:Cu+-exporting ATPase
MMNAPAPPRHWTLSIEGMTCASCVARVEKVLLKVPGVLSAQVNLATERADVALADPTAEAGALTAAVTKAGYAAHLVADGTADTATPTPAAPWWPIAVAAALTLPLVLPMLAMLWGADWALPGGLQWAPRRLTA